MEFPWNAAIDPRPENRKSLPQVPWPTIDPGTPNTSSAKQCQPFVLLAISMLAVMMAALLLPLHLQFSREN
jgi:hypothetical protein